VIQLVRELHVSHFQLLLLEVASWGMGIIPEPRVKGTSSIDSRYQATAGKDTADWQWDDIVRAVVNGRVCELAVTL
jgi:hypothetical protein